MGLHELTLRNFRLFTEYTCAPDPSAVTVFLSPNGTGKTSVLEAVNALATAASFRTSTASDLIKNNDSVAEVHGVIFQRERRIQVDLTLTRGLRNTTKRMLVNGQRPRSRAELSEILPLTVFTPEGVDVVRGGPEHRRLFLTNLLTDFDPSTGELIERFNRTLTQRNAFLRSLNGERPTVSQQNELEVWTSEFSESSQLLLIQRRILIDQLSPLVSDFYRELAHDTVDVSVVYETSWAGELRVALERLYNEDRLRGFTSVGPHRDDVSFSLNGRDVRRKASQGEQRSLALALRLAGHALIRQQRNLDPLLLLDDVFSELDPARSDRLLQLMPVGQTLVSTASPLPTNLTPSMVIDLSKVTS